MTLEISFKYVSNFSSKILLIQTIDKKPQTLWTKEIKSIKKLDTPVLIYHALKELIDYISTNYSSFDYKKELEKAMLKIHPKYLNKPYRMFIEDLNRNTIFTSIFYNSILAKSSLNPTS